MITNLLIYGLVLTASLTVIFLVVSLAIISSKGQDSELEMFKNELDKKLKDKNKDKDNGNYTDYLDW